MANQKIKHLRQRLWDRSKGRCEYCGELTSGFSASAKDPMRASLDHVVCKDHGGTDDESNLRLACIICNCAKHSRTLEEFRDYLTWRGSFFSRVQYDYLDLIGVELVRPPPYVFYFES